MRLLLIVASCLITAVGFSARAVHAQGEAATIQGTVLDSTGAVIPGATIVVTNMETNLTRTVGSNSTGFYIVPNLPPGAYRVAVSMAGFRASVHDRVALAVGQKLILNVALQVGEITEQVTVSGETLEVQTASSEVAGSVSPTRVQELPLLSRDFRDLTTLVPGVVPIPASYTQGSVTGNTRSFRTSVAGGRVGQTGYYLDGLSLNDRNGMAPAGVTGGQLGIDLVREFRVLVNSYSAEFGKSGSGAITMVSRSGTNSFRGSIFEFFRNDKLNARNFFDIPNKAPLRRNQFGFSLGGPIRKDTTFFFASWEGLRERNAQTVVSVVPDVNARRGLLPGAGGNLVAVENRIGDNLAQAVMNLYPPPSPFGRNFGNGSAQSIVPFSVPTRDDLLNVRLDRRLTTNHSLFGRYTFDNGSNTVPLAVPTFLQLARKRTQWLTLQEDGVASPSVVNTFRAGFSRAFNVTNERPAEGTKVDPAIIIPGRWDPGSFIIGNLSLAGQRADSAGGGSVLNTFQYSDDVVATWGQHTMKFGARFERYQTNNTGLRGSRDGLANGTGEWRFLTLADFFAGRVFNLRDNFGAITSYALRQSLFGAYLQDEYRVLSNLTLNLGLRVEHQTPPRRRPPTSKMVNIFTDTSNSLVEFLYETDPVLSPRVGLAWSPLTRDQSFVVRAGAGIFYDQLGGGFYGNGIGNNFPYNAQVNSRDVPFPAPYSANTFPSPSGTSRAFAYDQHQNMPALYQYNLSLAKAFHNQMQVTASYVGSQARHLTIAKQVNTYPRSIVNGRVFYDKTGPTANPNYRADIYNNGTEGNSYYHSAQLSIKSPLSRGSTLEGSYTLSKCIDAGSVENTSDFGGIREKFVYDAFNMKNNRGLCNMDMRNRFVLNVVYALPFQNLSGFGKVLLGGWSVSSIVQVSDGLPFLPRTTFPRSNNLAAADNSRSERPDLAPGAKVAEHVFPGRVDQYYDPKLFVLQPEGFLGNAGRNLIPGPGLATVDLSVVRAIPIKKEEMQLQIRAEFFNLFNRVNLGLPNWEIFTDQTGRPNPAAGRISNTSTNSRQVQMALKLVF